MKVKIILIIALVVICLPFAILTLGVTFTSVSVGIKNMQSGEVDDIEYPEPNEALSGATLITLGDGSDTWESVRDMVDDLTDNILSALFSEYGENALSIYHHRSGEDTHKNAIWQDGWAWAGGESYLSANSESWTAGGFDGNGYIKADYSLVLKYNIYQILLGKDIVEIQVTGLNNSSLYSSMYANGDFSSATFKSFAKKVSHTGLFYYEADAISEYILNYVIGERALDYDKRKFSDVNGNGTFDYNEDIKVLLGLDEIDAYFTIIKNYNMNKIRSEKTNKSDVFAGIEFGETITNPEASEVVKSEKALDIEFLKTNNLANSYEIGTDVYYSGFKNYVNTVYYIVYSAVGDVFTMEHKPNANIQDVGIDDVVANYGTVDEDFNEEDIEDVDTFKMSAKEYIGVIFKGNQEFSWETVSFCFRLGDSVQEDVDITIVADYYHCTNVETHEHNESCVFEKITAFVDTITVIHGDKNDTDNVMLLDLTTTQEEIDELSNTDYYIDDLKVSEFVELGVYSFDLTKFLDFEDNETVACENQDLKGCAFEYSKNYNDFLEFRFSASSENYEKVPFTFAILWM